MLRRSLTVVLTAALAIGIAACGDDNNGDSASTAAPAPAPAATTADSGGAGGTTVKLAADPGGNLAYDKKTLTAKAGEVTVDFTNEASVPHNVVIEQGEDEAGTTETIQGSETSKSFTLTAGTYTFYCSVGQHRQAGMEGTLTVQ